MGISYDTNRKKQLQRDLEIFHFLGCGVATSDQIRRALFQRESGQVVARQTCDRRLAKLTAMGYLLKQQYKSSLKIVTLYCLAERGIDELAKSTAIERSHIRSGMPRIEKALHEVVLSAIMRKIRTEARDGAYNLVCVYDDVVMKSYTKPARGVFYPDLLVKLMRPKNGPTSVYIELDMGNKSRNYWVRKITSWQNTTLVLVPYEHRAKIMRGYMLASRRVQPTGFALVNRFLMDGLLGTIFDWLPSNTKAKFNLE